MHISARSTGRLALLLVVLAVLTLPLALVDSLPAMGIAMTVAGFGLAPSLALAFQLVAEVSPAGTVTEAMTWISSALAAGLAGGAALGGWAVERSGTTAALLLVVGYGLASAAVAASGRGVLAASTA